MCTCQIFQSWESIHETVFWYVPTGYQCILAYSSSRNELLNCTESGDMEDDVCGAAVTCV
jgi:hypothetical protein